MVKELGPEMRAKILSVKPAVSFYLGDGSQLLLDLCTSGGAARDLSAGRSVSVAYNSGGLFRTLRFFLLFFPGLLYDQLLLSLEHGTRRQASIHCCRLFRTNFHEFCSAPDGLRGLNSNTRNCPG